MRLELAKKEDYDQIKKLYQSAFPRNERAPYFLFRRQAQRGRARLLVAREGQEFLGFAYLICLRDMAYLFYFAVDEARRGQGIGSRILRALQKLFEGRRFFLAREQLDESADNYRQRISRHEFYLKNGFEDWPCQIREATVVYDVMGRGAVVSTEEYRELMDYWCGGLIRRLVFMKLMQKEK